MRAAVYLDSTGKPEQKDSLVYQKHYFEHYIKKKDGSLWLLCDVKTGTVENRDGFKKMLEDKIVFDIILAKNQVGLRGIKDYQWGKSY